MAISPSFNDKEFFEFIWMFERMVSQRTRENEEKQKSGGGGRQNIMNGFGG